MGIYVVMVYKEKQNICIHAEQREGKIQITHEKEIRQVGLSRATLEFQVNAFILIILDSRVKLLDVSRIQIN